MNQDWTLTKYSWSCFSFFTPYSFASLTISFWSDLMNLRPGYSCKPYIEGIILAWGQWHMLQIPQTHTYRHTIQSTAGQSADCSPSSLKPWAQASLSSWGYLNPSVGYFSSGLTFLFNLVIQIAGRYPVFLLFKIAAVSFQTCSIHTLNLKKKTITQTKYQKRTY